MKKMITCIKLKKELLALSIPPIPGSKGQWIVENVSEEAWKEWQKHQTRLINEKHLNLLQLKDRQYLMLQMEKYFNNEDIDNAEGYIPEN